MSTSVKISEQQLPGKATFSTILLLNFSNFRSKQSEKLSSYKIVKEIMFGWAWGELESKETFQRQLLTKYLRRTLVSM